MTERRQRVGVVIEAFRKTRAAGVPRLIQGLILLQGASPSGVKLALSNSRPRESCDSDDFPYLFPMPERIQKPVEPAPWGPKKGDGDGPRSPDISRPDTKDLLNKMRKVDPNQSKRYRQRTGQ